MESSISIHVSPQITGCQFLSFSSSPSGRFKQDGIQSPTRQGLGYVSSKTMSLAKLWFSFTGVAVLSFCRYMYMYQHICVSQSQFFCKSVSDY